MTKSTQWILLLFVLLNSKLSSCSNGCYENFLSKNKSNYLLEFEKPIENFILYYDDLIVTSSSYIYLFGREHHGWNNFVLKHCLSGDQDVIENKILLQLNNPNSYLTCNIARNDTFTAECSEVEIRNDRLVWRTKFTFAFDFDLRSCTFLQYHVIDKSIISFFTTCEPGKTNSSYTLFGNLMLDVKRGTFKIFQNKIGIQVSLGDDQPENYQMNFVHSLIWPMHDYGFVLKRERLNGQDFQVKLGRVRLERRSFRRYIEIPLSCRDRNTGETYAYAHKAHFVEWIGYRYSPILFVLFQWYDRMLNQVDRSKGTVLCGYEVLEANETFAMINDLCTFGGITTASKEKFRLIIYNSTNGRLSTGRHARCAGRDDGSVERYIESKELFLDGQVLFRFNETITTLWSSNFEAKSISVLHVEDFIYAGSVNGCIYVLTLGRLYQENLTVDLSEPVFELSKGPVTQMHSNKFVSGNKLYLKTKRPVVNHFRTLQNIQKLKEKLLTKCGLLHPTRECKFPFFDRKNFFFLAFVIIFIFTMVSLLPTCIILSELFFYY